MTGRDEDIAAALPRAPFPAPARREAAFAKAMRRFDGGELEAATAPGRPGPAPWRTRLNRPPARALAGAFLVAAIALPLAWQSFPEHARDGGGDRGRDRGADSRRPAAPGPAAADWSAAAPESGLASSIDRPGPRPRPPAARSVPAAAGAERAPAAAGASDPPPAAEMYEPAPAPKMYEPAPAPGAFDPLPQPAEMPPSAEVAPAPPQNQIVITGARIRRPNLESSVPVTSIGGEEFFQTGRPARRGDWNACTVDDPKRDLKACRGDVATVARGASGAASTHLADGLARAWEGEPQKAIDSFDRAIAISPRSSAAYLNRGLARRDLGDFDGALGDLDRAIAYAPRSARGYYHRSLLLRQRGDSRRARADEERAVELDPRYAAPLRAGRKQKR